MSEKQSIPPLVQASISHFVAKRDKALAELELCLTNSANVSLKDKENVVDRINKLFEDVDRANSVLNTISEIVDISSNNDVEK